MIEILAELTEIFNDADKVNRMTSSELGHQSVSDVMLVNLRIDEDNEAVFVLTKMVCDEDGCHTSNYRDISVFTVNQALSFIKDWSDD